MVYLPHPGWGKMRRNFQLPNYGKMLLNNNENHICGMRSFKKGKNLRRGNRKKTDTSGSGICRPILCCMSYCKNHVNADFGRMGENEGVDIFRQKTSVDFVQFLNHAPSTLIFNLSDWI